MPRSGASSVSFDEAWDWTDPEPRRAQRGDLAYYDWSEDESFAPRRRRLQAVPNLPARSAAAPAPVRRSALAAPASGRSAAAPSPAAAPAPVTDEPAAPATAGRRTITITGRGAEGHLPARRPAASAERMRAKPDRIAMWAVVLGILMILAAATSAHAAVLH